MKKILFAIAIVLTLGLTANAQGFDGFFANRNDVYGDRDPGMGLPDAPMSNDPSPAPLGTGLLIMTALGAGYTMAKCRKK